MPSRRHRSFTVTSRRKPPTRCGSSLRGCPYAGSPTSPAARTIGSPESALLRPVLRLYLTDTILFLSWGNSTLTPGAHTKSEFSGVHTLKCVPLWLTVYTCRSRSGSSCKCWLAFVGTKTPEMIWYPRARVAREL